MYTTLISPEELHQNLNTPNWLIFDCRTELSDPHAGRRAYAQGHLPGALFADLDEDLCGPIRPRPDGFTETGRHPLPDVETFVATLNQWGVTNQTQVIAYDDKGGGLSAARLWWMLRWVGHDMVAVLDGGWQGWVGKGYPVSSEAPSAPQPGGKPFKVQMRDDLLIDATDVLKAREEFSPLLILDSRAPERYRGETEPIDPVAGRVPWARNAPYTNTQTPEGFFRPKPELKAHFEKLLGLSAGKNAVFYCGSGVTAAANLLALKHAGLGDGKLYSGSWSDWITDPTRPIGKD
ncbi:MAG: sulfurtransferase [Anaerolineales bacterium]|nr:sulfurtransferase [Anaerolineales bacterium]